MSSSVSLASSLSSLEDGAQRARARTVPHANRADDPQRAVLFDPSLAANLHWNPFTSLKLARQQQTQFLTSGAAPPAAHAPAAAWSPGHRRSRSSSGVPRAAPLVAATSTATHDDAPAASAGGSRPVALDWSNLATVSHLRSILASLDADEPEPAEPPLLGSPLRSSNSVRWVAVRARARCRRPSLTAAAAAQSPTAEPPPPLPRKKAATSGDSGAAPAMPTKKAKGRGTEVQRLSRDTRSPSRRAFDDMFGTVALPMVDGVEQRAAVRASAQRRGRRQAALDTKSRNSSHESMPKARSALSVSGDGAGLGASAATMSVAERRKAADDFRKIFGGGEDEPPLPPKKGKKKPGIQAPPPPAAAKSSAAATMTAQARQSAGSGQCLRCMQVQLWAHRRVYSGRTPRAAPQRAQRQHREV